VTLQHVKPGDVVDRTAVSENAIRDAANWVASNRARLFGGQGSSDVSTLLIRNDAAGDVVRGQLLGIDGVVVPYADDVSEFYFHTTLKGIIPATPTHIGKWAMAVEPIVSGNIGRALVSGVMAVPITMNHADHPFADIANSSYTLTSNWYGSAEILYTAATSGSTYAVVRVGTYVSPIYKATSDGAITAGGSGTVTIKKNGSSSQQVTAYLNWMSGTHNTATGDELAIQFFRDENKWVILNAECSA
jgi:hypothetical protein